MICNDRLELVVQYDVTYSPFFCLLCLRRGLDTWWSLSGSDIKKTGALCKFSAMLNRPSLGRGRRRGFATCFSRPTWISSCCWCSFAYRPWPSNQSGFDGLAKWSLSGIDNKKTGALFKFSLIKQRPAALGLIFKANNFIMLLMLVRIPAVTVKSERFWRPC